MAYKRGELIGGAEAWFGALVTPAELSLTLSNANAGGAAVIASFMGQSNIDQPLPFDLRIYWPWWDKGFTGTITVTPIVNGLAQPAFAVALDAATFGAGPGRTFHNITPGNFAFGHGDTFSWQAQCDALFTTVGDLTMRLFPYGSITVQPNFVAWTPT